MRRFLTYVLCSVLLGFSISMPAQNLPALQKDGTITTGALSNGISFYLVTNSTMKGVADFALVRKGMTDSLAARSELSSLPHFNKTVPYKFLSRKGIGCRPDGYISFVEDATLFRFDDVPMFDVAASDTTLLMLFDIIAAKPCPHAVVISGDINPAAIIEKMKVFSLMVPSRTTSYQPKAYSWTPAEETGYSFVPSPIASVEVDFRSPRTPADQMNTIQPFISKLFSLELADLVKYRLKESLVSRDIPVRFFRTAKLVNTLSTKMKADKLDAFREKISKASIIILDEFGYVPYDRDGINILFDFLSEISDDPTKVVILNTNLEFSRWVNVLYDQKMTAALIGRLTHRCHLILFPGENNRLKESSINLIYRNIADRQERLRGQ